MKGLRLLSHRDARDQPLPVSGEYGSMLSARRPEGGLAIGAWTLPSAAVIVTVEPAATADFLDGTAMRQKRTVPSR